MWGSISALVEKAQDLKSQVEASIDSAMDVPNDEVCVLFALEISLDAKCQISTLSTFGLARTTRSALI